MVAITNRLVAFRSSQFRPRLGRIATVALEAIAILLLAQRGGWWPLALAVAVVAELWAFRPHGGVRTADRNKALLAHVPAMLMAVSVVLIIAVVPRLATQIGAAALLVVWRVWWDRDASARTSLAGLLTVQAAVFEAVFLMAAIWRTPDLVALALAWFGAYVSVYAVLSARGERAAGVMAAAWAVVTVEVGRVLLWWLFTYTMTGGYVLVPQPALILTALGYCFGSIYLSQREGNLSRGRLAEYLLIGVILIGIVVVGTSWGGAV